MVETGVEPVRLSTLEPKSIRITISISVNLAYNHVAPFQFRLISILNPGKIVRGRTVFLSANKSNGMSQQSDGLLNKKNRSTSSLLYNTLTDSFELILDLYKVKVCELLDFTCTFFHPSIKTNKSYDS